VCAWKFIGWIALADVVGNSKCETHCGEGDGECIIDIYGQRLASRISIIVHFKCPNMHPYHIDCNRCRPTRQKVIIDGATACGCECV
jgi:hypothetical protein